MTIPASAQLPNYPCFANARTYDAEWLRMTNQCWAGGEGIAPFDDTKDTFLAASGLSVCGDLLATTGASGLNVSVAAGNAWVKGDGRTTQGLYFTYVDVAKTVTMTAAHATLPRVDAIILKVDDADVSGSATQWTVTKQDGTATVGATLANLTGAPGQSGGPTFQTTALLLAYILTPALFAGPYVNATHIKDARYFAYRPGRVIGFKESLTDVGPTALNNSRTATLLGASMTVACDNVHDVEMECQLPRIDCNAATDTKIEVWRDGIATGTKEVDQFNRYVGTTQINAVKFTKRLATFGGLTRAYDMTIFAAATPTVSSFGAASSGGPMRMIARYK